MLRHNYILIASRFHPVGVSLPQLNISLISFCHMTVNRDTGDLKRIETMYLPNAVYPLK